MTAFTTFIHVHARELLLRVNEKFVVLLGGRPQVLDELLEEAHTYYHYRWFAAEIDRYDRYDRYILHPGP